MANPGTEDGLLPSVLDRLIDPDSGGTAWRQGYGLEQIVDAVQRDLEDLLNTRQSHSGLPTGFTEVQQSIVAYGLPELTSLNAVTPSQRAEIGRLLEAVVMRFEPRLRDVRATVVEGAEGLERTIKFRLQARVNVDPAPEVAFDTILELTTGRYSVENPTS